MTVSTTKTPNNSTEYSNSAIELHILANHTNQIIFVTPSFYHLFIKVNRTFLARINYMLIKSQIHDSKPRSRFRIQGLHVVQNPKPLSTIAGKIACNTAFYYLVYSYVH